MSSGVVFHRKVPKLTREVSNFWELLPIFRLEPFWTLKGIKFPPFRIAVERGDGSRKTFFFKDLEVFFAIELEHGHKLSQAYFEGQY